MGAILSGYLTGSGRLARFVDTTGQVIDHLQIASHWTEEILVSDAHGFSERWLYSRAREFTNGIINRSISRYHTPTVVNSHPVSFATYSRPLIESNWKTAREGGVADRLGRCLGRVHRRPARGVDCAHGEWVRGQRGAAGRSISWCFVRMKRWHREAGCRPPRKRSGGAPTRRSPSAASGRARQGRSRPAR